MRYPTPPKNIGAPSPAIDFFNKFNEMIKFQQNLISALEIKQKQVDLSTSVSTQKAEDKAEAKAWFNG
jgi:hypothetical protein|tara:strand:+ start:220 stop:423 length:204 start_codon:yes stop_codon:yes gene_type:complete